MYHITVYIHVMTLLQHPSFDILEKSKESMNSFEGSKDL